MDVKSVKTSNELVLLTHSELELLIHSGRSVKVTLLRPKRRNLARNEMMFVTKAE